MQLNSNLFLTINFCQKRSMEADKGVDLMTTLEIDKEIRHGNKKIVLYTLHIIIGGLLFGMWNWLQWFANKLLFIPFAVIAVIFLIYSTIDGFNDPIVGYLTDRSTRFTARWGKRFPWIISCLIVGPILLISSFIPIGSGPDPEGIIIAAIWLVLTMVVYETILTVNEVNYNALFPDMFRNLDERKKVSIIASGMGVINSVLGVVLIPIVLVALGADREKFNDPEYVYSTAEVTPNIIAFLGTAIVIVVICYILLIPFIWGVRETDEMKTFRTDLDQTGKSTSPVKEVIVRIFKDRNWMAVVLAYFCYTVAGMLLLQGLNYFVIDNLGGTIGDLIIPKLMAVFGGVIAIPIFLFLAKKVGSKNGYLISFILLAITFSLFFFVSDLTSLTLVLGFGGIGLGGAGIMYTLITAEAIDNAVIESGKREEATYNGVLRIFSGYSYFFQTLIFAIVGFFSGYDERKALQSEAAKLGIQLQVSLIPLLILLIGIFILAFTYKIRKEDAAANVIKLKELGL